jgi:hypothetical protein
MPKDCSVLTCSLITIFLLFIRRETSRENKASNSCEDKRSATEKGSSEVGIGKAERVASK